MRVGIVGGGISGLVAAYELQKRGIPFTLYESGWRMGGIVETTRDAGFVMEGGPDGWVTEKPWLRELLVELGLGDEMVPSNDAERVTYVYRDGVLHAIPDGMRMMVPTDLDALRKSSLFSGQAINAYEEEISRADKLKQYAAEHNEDESVASFVRRHFGDEVTRTIAAPLLAGVFGGDVEQLSASSVMPQFVAMEREYGSLIVALREKARHNEGAIFTSLKSGMGMVVETLLTKIPAEKIRSSCRVDKVARDGDAWLVGEDRFDQLVLATPTHVTRSLLFDVDMEASKLLAIDASSAVLVFLGYDAEQAREMKKQVPRGFGFLVPPGTAGTDLLAGTFVDQKFSHRVPEGGVALRAFFGSAAAERYQDESDAFLVAVARRQMEEVLKVALPEPKGSVVRKWPRSLPQYGVGHADRMRRLAERMALYPTLTLLGNAYRGVGLPDLVRDARAEAQRIATQAS